MSEPLKQRTAQTLATEFINRSGSISPAVLRLGGGSYSASSINELEGEVAIDPEFTLRVLALANSAFYSQQHEIHSLRGALVVLGTGAVYNLAASLLVRGLQSSPLAADERLWDHCQAVAVAAQTLAEAHGRTHPDQAFAAGLLHDIGILALQVLGYHETDVDTHHSDLGADIAQQLGLPTSLVAAIRHHDDMSIHDAKDRPLEATIYIANDLVAQSGLSFDGDSYGDRDRLLEMASSLGLEAPELETLAATLPVRLQNHHVTFDGSKKDCT